MPLGNDSKTIYAESKTHLLLIPIPEWRSSECCGWRPKSRRAACTDCLHHLATIDAHPVSWIDSSWVGSSSDELGITYINHSYLLINPTPPGHIALVSIEVRVHTAIWRVWLARNIPSRSPSSNRTRARARAHANFASVQ